MRARHVRLSVAAALGVAALAAGAALAPASAATGHQADQEGRNGHVSHVLLISVDGLHQQDLAWYVKTYPHSALAALVLRGMEYSNAETPVPSDSFPGMVAQVTGGDPWVTGIYYDDTWNHDVFPAGTTSCPGPCRAARPPTPRRMTSTSIRLTPGKG